MDETMQNLTTEDELDNQKESNENGELKDAIEQQLRKIRRQSMMMGSQAVCHAVLEKIFMTMRKPGKRTMNDYKRLIKDIESFCTTGISRKINEDGEIEIVDENNTKLMEESDD